MRPKLLALLLSAVLVVATGITGVATMAAPARAAETTIPENVFLSAMTGGNTVGSPIREDEARADGYRHIDTSKMIKRLQELSVTMYSYGIWDMATDWDDLRNEFAPAAEAAGIDIMVYIVPPTECFLNEQKHLDGRCSRPFNMDYVRWAEETATLSLAHSNVKSWGIDDFLVGQNGELFTKEYLAEIRAAMDVINPDIKWYVTLYYWEINPENVAIIEDSLDGIIYPYNGYNNNTIDPTWLETRLDGALDTMKPSGLDLVLLVYNGRFLDGIIHPDERYAAEVLKRAEPYLADGRLVGVVAYGAPVDLKLAQPSWDYWGHSGNGRLSLSVSNFTTTVDGSYASATQEVQVPPGSEAKVVSFAHHDQDDGGDGGYHTKQLLVDDEVVWEQETVSDPQDQWITTEVDVTEALAGKSHATISFRLLDKKGVGWWPLDWSIDEVEATGFTLQNGGFETQDDWRLDRNEPTMQPYIDIFTADRPTKIFNAISEGYARYQGKTFTPVASPQWPNLKIGPDNRAMYGNGRLEFAIDKDTPIPANTCSTAWQDVPVVAGLPRYELSFWHADPTQANFDQLFKQIRIDDKTLWDRDAGDYWNWFYIHGSDHQGVIDVTDFVQGKKTVRLEFAVCSKKAVAELETKIGFDHLETIGLDVTNSEFESSAGWTIEAEDPITAGVDVHGPCQASDAKVITGDRRGPLQISGTTCLQDAAVRGPVTVEAGASLHVISSTITGPVSAESAASVIITDSSFRGAVDIRGTSEELSIEDGTFRGQVSLVDNKTEAGTSLLQSNRISGSLTCSGNVPGLVALGYPNQFTGPVTGSCG